jgi:hypothetical protein
MPVALVVQGVTYQYPIVSSEGWGTEATDWAVAINSVVNSIIVDGDLGPTVLVTIANNQSSAANVTSLAFNSATIRSAQVQYFVYRTWNSGTEEAVENGILFLNYKDIAAVWDLVQIGNNVEGSGVVFSITAGGQVQYISDNKSPSTGYAGSCKYRATVLAKT